MNKGMISTTGLSTDINNKKLKLKCGQHQTATQKKKNLSYMAVC